MLNINFVRGIAMKRSLMASVIVFIIILVSLFSVISSYNKLVTMDEQVTSSWKQVENLLQRRYDLIPNLVEVTKGYAKHEEEIFTQIANARARIQDGGSREDLINANNELSGALSRLLLVVENYPDLKANEQFIRLQDELAGTENRLAVSRQDYNRTVETYNKKIRRFPTSIIAKAFDFERHPYFEMDQNAKEAPKVKFN